MLSRASFMRTSATRSLLRPVSTTSRSMSAVTFQFNPDRAIACYETDGPANSTSAEATKEEMISYYTQMFRARRMEVINDNLYKDGKIRGFCHLYDGQEAIGMGMEAAMTKDDAVTTSYRCHAWQLFRGDNEGIGDTKAVFAELMGRYSGCSKGKGGSMHMYHKEHNFYGGNGIVGAQTSTATGNAFAFKYMGEPGSYNVSFGLYGDGAANQGQLFESMNMAALWKLPMVYVCENNKFGMGTSTKRSSALDEYYKRGQYMPGIKVDGMDVLCVRDCTKFAIEQCRAGNGPFVLEMDTYRYHGHSMSDPGITYRTRKEIQAVRAARDPCTMQANRILEAGFMTEDEMKALDKKIKAEVQAASDAAELDSMPPDNELWDNIYTKDMFARGVELQNSHIA